MRTWQPVRSRVASMRKAACIVVLYYSSTAAIKELSSHKTSTLGQRQQIIHFLEMQYVARLGIAGVHIRTWYIYYIVNISFMYPYESALFYTELRIAIEIYLKTAVM